MSDLVNRMTKSQHCIIACGHQQSTVLAPRQPVNSVNHVDDERQSLMSSPCFNLVRGFSCLLSSVCKDLFHFIKGCGRTSLRSPIISQLLKGDAGAGCVGHCHGSGSNDACSMLAQTLLQRLLSNFPPQVCTYRSQPMRRLLEAFLNILLIDLLDILSSVVLGGVIDGILCSGSACTASILCQLTSLFPHLAHAGACCAQHFRNVN
mmetsp:Transcript_107907/g.187306  ORF Transcript_107907/g.187306 Transcript_107907/m.187306 type:complete len:206 (+) Transcript_107907:677-1294(+)